MWNAERGTTHTPSTSSEATPACQGWRSTPRRKLVRTTSRTIFAAAFGLAVALLTLGCGSKPQPTTPDVKITPDEKGGDPKDKSGPDKKVEPATKAAHEMDADKHAYPPGPVAGTVGGADFTPIAFVDGDNLVFQTTNPETKHPERLVKLKLRASGQKTLENRVVRIRLDTPTGPEVPFVTIQTPPRPKRPDQEPYANGYALSLELGPRKGGKISGKIYISFPDDEKTFFAGSFEADYSRQPTEPPGVEDVPLVNGAVTLRGAPVDSVLVVGYAATPTPTTSAFGVGEIRVGDPVLPVRWSQTTHDTPRVTTLIAGDGKTVPSRYEHSKLAPGRYLVFAAVKNGPVAWKWVDVTKDSTVAADLTIDATQTGGLEVTVPLEALGKVQLGPAEESNHPPLIDGLFQGVALQLGLEQSIVQRKALFKNLAPGKYEVRASRQTRIIEIVAGKTAELDFDKKPIEPKKPPEVAPEPQPKP